MTAAQALQPDIAIQLDLLLATDTPDMGYRGDVRLGAGPGDEHVFLPWARHAERNDPASGTGIAVRRDGSASRHESAAQCPYRRAHGFFLCAAGRQRRRLDRSRLSHALFAFLARGLRSRRSRAVDNAAGRSDRRRSTPASASIAINSSNEPLSRHRHRNVRIEGRHRRRQRQDRCHRFETAQDAGAAAGLGRAQAQAGLVGRFHLHL